MFELTPNQIKIGELIINYRAIYIKSPTIVLIAKKLGYSPQRVSNCVRRMVQKKLLAYVGGQYIPTEKLTNMVVRRHKKKTPK